MMAQQFIILGLPRSRTYWLSKFLSYRDWYCGHDQLQYMRSLDDVRAWLDQPCTGTVETGAAPFWRLLMNYAPNIKIATVRRPVDDVIASLSWSGIPVDDSVVALIRQHDRKLDQIEKRVPNVLSMKYSDLSEEPACAAIFEHCLPYPHDTTWWAARDKDVVSGNVRAQMRYADAHLPQIQKLANLAKHRTLALMTPKGEAPAGFTFQEEDFDSWERDGVHLFEEHCVTAGEAVDQWKTKNIPLMRRLWGLGNFKILTARSNGRMFGYITAVISPSLETTEGTMANLLLPYASKDAPGLGKKLQDAMIEQLRSEGVGEAFARAGIRGDGPRITALYRRSGFRDYGTIHRLALQESTTWGS